MIASPPQRRYYIGQQAHEAPALPPGLYLTATPIGNLGDITLRALACLAAADVILCEDTRNTARLAQRYSIRAPLKPYHDHNGAKVRPAVLEMLRQGKVVALVSDAGTPLVNDPGYKLVREALADGLRVEMLPGPSAPIMALALSGLPSDRFLFAGFLPPKSAARKTMLKELATVRASLIFFETAPRIEASLGDISEVMPGRAVAIARELTKLHEEVLRGLPATLAADIAGRGGLKGEITLVIAPPADNESAPDSMQVDGMLRDCLARMGVKEAAAEVAVRTGLGKRELYARAQAIKDEDPA